ncbi:MAG: LacI family transcriptional regulator [Cytophagaceae bacterium]|jgi:LacI family transcriptional regulator|nr:LacI family transcriptional regulator [Cytophagaceae bacterium]
MINIAQTIAQLTSEQEKPSIKRISELTGYSHSSVSRVLNGLGDQYRISKKAQAAIVAKAQELHFTPNQIARGLRLKKTETLGLIVPNIANPFFAEIAKIITRKARSYGYSILLLDSEDTLEIENQSLRTLLARKTDGIILFPSTSNNELVEKIHSDGIPIVLVDRYYQSSAVPYVSSDNFQGAKEATRFLLQQGHQNLLCIQGNPDSSPNQERVRGFLQALQEAGITNNSARVIGNAFSEQNGYDSTRQAIQQRSITPFTALFTLSNLNAMGAWKALHEAGLSVPADVSLLTFDNQELLTLVSPAVTAVDQPKVAIGETALDMLMQQIQQIPLAQTQLQLPTQLIIRKSVQFIN